MTCTQSERLSRLVTEAAGIRFVFRHVALEVGAGQVVEQHVELRAEQIAPAPEQMGEEFVLVCEQAVEAAIERVVLGNAFVHAEQIGQRGGGKPVPGQPPFTARGEPPVKRKHAEDFLPVRAFATTAQARSEEGIELEVAPELIAQPARAPGARAGELQFMEPHLHGGGVASQGGAIFGKERALPGLALLFVEDFDGLLPGGALGVVDLTQIEDVALHDAASDATALDDRPGAMRLAVLFARTALEKHAGEYSWRTPGWKGLGRHYTRFWTDECENPSETHAAVRRKKSEPKPSSGSRVSE